MMGRTHLMIGAAAGALVEQHAPGLLLLEGMAVGALGGLLPDLDHPNSLLTQKVAPITIGGSRKLALALTAVGVLYVSYKGWLPIQHVVLIAIWVLIAAFAKHRGITHSLLGLAMASYALQGWLGPLGTAFAAAYGSHLAADALTHGGVPLLWPYLRDFRIPTGWSTGKKFTKKVEKLFQAASFACLVWLVLQAAPQVWAAVAGL